MNAFLTGACAMGSVVAAMFFLRFWKATRDRLFMFFALAFLGLALNWMGLVLVEPEVESRHWLYVLRLVAFLLIVAGIVDKNRASPQ